MYNNPLQTSAAFSIPPENIQKAFQGVWKSNTGLQWVNATLISQFRLLDLQSNTYAFSLAYNKLCDRKSNAFDKSINKEYHFHLRQDFPYIFQTLK